MPVVSQQRLGQFVPSVAHEFEEVAADMLFEVSAQIRRRHLELIDHCRERHQRLASMDDESVTFHYRDYRENGKVKQMTLEVMEFLRRFMQHVLPSGFQRIRYYGFLSNCHRKTKLQQYMRLTRMRAQPKEKLIVRALILKLMKDIARCPCGGAWCRVLTLERGSP